MKPGQLATLVIFATLLLAPAAWADATGDLLQAMNQGSSKQAQAAILKGANVNVRHSNGNSPLHWAVKYGNKPLIGLLIAKGADIDARDQNGSTLLFEAASEHDTPLLDYLLTQGARPDATTETGLTPLMAAVTKDADMVKRLLDKGASLDVTGPGGWTLLMNAASAGADQNVSLLLARGADLEARYGGDGDPATGGQTALLIAAAAGKASTVKLLLDQGARPDAVDNQGRTALMLAARYTGFGYFGTSEAQEARWIHERSFDEAILGKQEVVALLLKLGADPARKDKLGLSALDYAREYAEKYGPITYDQPASDYQALVDLLSVAPTAQ